MKNIFCIFNIHKWEVTKSIRASNLIFLIQKTKKILKRSTYELENDFIVYDKTCKRCKKQNSEIKETRKMLEEKLTENLRKKI